LAKLGHNARLTRANGYFYFDSGDAAEWLDKMVNTPILGSRTLEQWLEEFTRLEKVNRELLKGTARPAPEKKARRRRT